jgi:ABC-type Co2+ transport system permease subunit
MRFLTLAALGIIPLVAFFVAQRLSGNRVFISILAAAFTSSVIGAILAGAATGMAPWLSPQDAVLRGAAFGFLGGLPVGAAAAFVTILWRRRIRGD